MNMNASSSLLCINRINSFYKNLSRAEKEIADFVVFGVNNHSEKDVFRSAHALANATGTSPATVVRFCKSIGFNGFTDFKMNLFKDVLEPSSTLPDLNPDDSIAIVKQKALIFNKRAIDGLFSMLSEESIEKAITVLKNARRILVLGDGGSGSSARIAYDIFLELRLNSEYVTDPFFQVMVIGQLTPNDVVFAICHSGRSKNIIENVKQAKEMGVPTIGIIGMPNTPIAKYFDIELYSNVFRNDYFCDSVAAQISEISVLSVLHSVLALRSNAEDILLNKKLMDTLDKKRVQWGEKI